MSPELPDQVDPVRSHRRSRGPRPPPPGGPTRTGSDRRPLVRRRRERQRGGGTERVLPSPGRARGLRIADSSGDDDARPPADVANGRGGRRDAGAGRPGRVRQASMSGYYGRPILKQPIWGPAVAAYFFTRGLAGISGALSFTARVRGNRALAKSALVTSAAGLGVSLPLLVMDLGKPERFLNMLRVVKPTSPMSIGSWILSGFGAATGLAGASEGAGAIRLPGLVRPLGLIRPVGLVAQGASALLGTGVATYTAVLLSDTAVPAWHEGRREMPFVFAGSASASAGGAAAILTPVEDAGPARRMAIGGALIEVAASELMKRRLGQAA